MVADWCELWFNSGMLKSKAIDLLGAGEVSAAADALGISYQAVNKWPKVLPLRISDRVLGACMRRGIPVSAEVLKAAERTPPPALAGQAVQAIETEVKEAAHG